MGQDYLWQTANPCGGVNNRLPDTHIADNELSDAANYQPDMTGQGWLIKRNGLSAVSSDSKAGASYSIYNGLNANYWHNGTVLYNFTGTQLDTGLTAAYDSWASFGGYDCYVNGTDAEKTSDGSAFSAIANIPAGTKYIASSMNFLYGAGHAQGKLRYCDYGDITTWTATNELVLTQDENDDIIGLLPVTNALGVWCTKSFYFITGYSNIDQQVSYYNKSDGCTASRSIVNTPYGIFWWGRSGIAWLKEGYVLDYPMQRKLTKTLASAARAYDSLTHAAWDQEQQCVMFFVYTSDSSTYPSVRVDYYPYYDAFFLQTGTGIRMTVSAPAIVSSVRSVHVSGPAETYLYKYSTAATDHGVTITSYLSTKREGSPLVLRDGRVVVVQTALTGTETITYKSYVDNTSTATDTYSISTASGLQDTKILLNRQNNRLMHYITDATTSTRSRILGITHTGHAERMD